MDLLVGVGGLDQRTDRGRRGVEDRDLVVLDHLPETAGIRIGRHTLEHDLGGAAGQRAVGDVGVAGDPADVGGAPEDVVGLDVEGVLHRQHGLQQVAAAGMLDTLRLAGRARGIEQEQRVLGLDPLRLAGVGLAGERVVEPDVATLGHGDCAAGALDDDDVLDGLAVVAAGVGGQGLVGDRLQRQRLAAAELAVRGDQRNRASTLDTVAQRLRRETAEHHRVGRADAGAGLHRDDALDRHRQVDDDAVTLLDAHPAQRIAKLADATQQILVGDLGDFAAVGFEDDRDLVAQAVVDLAVDAVVGDVQLAVREPLEERRIALVQHGVERRLPVQQFAGMTTPVTLVVALGLVAQCLVRFHARHCCILNQLFRGIVQLGLGRLVIRHCSPLLISLQRFQDYLLESRLGAPADLVLLSPDFSGSVSPESGRIQRFHQLLLTSDLHVLHKTSVNFSRCATFRSNRQSDQIDLLELIGIRPDCAVQPGKATGAMASIPAPAGWHCPKLRSRLREGMNSVLVFGGCAPAPDEPPTGAQRPSRGSPPVRQTTGAAAEP